MHILYTALYTFPKVLTGRTLFLCLKTFYSGVILEEEIWTLSLLGIKGSTKVKIAVIIG